MTTAGLLRERVRFERRGPDANGDLLGEWQPLFFARARIQYLRGTETVMAQRLEGEQPIVATIRSTAAARALTSDCRLVDARTGAVFNIRSVTLDERRQWIDVLALGKGGGSVG